MQIGERIKNVREAKDMPQKEVALKLEMDQSQYSKIENGKTDPYFSTIKRIAEALEVDLNDLLAPTDAFQQINSYDKPMVEKVKLIQQLEEKEQKCIFSLVDELVAKQRLEDSLTKALNNNV